MNTLSSYLNEEKPVLMNFSSGFSVSISEKLVIKDPSLQNFSNTTEQEDLSIKLVNFSLLDYIRENRLPARQSIQNRIRQVIRYINSNSIKNIVDNRESLVNYLNVYIQTIVNNLLSTAGTGTVPNLSVMLGIRQYTTDNTTITQLQIVLNRLVKQVKSQGFINQQIQSQLKKYYNKLIADILYTIDLKNITKDKKGLLSGHNFGMAKIKEEIIPEAEEPKQELVTKVATS